MPPRGLRCGRDELGDESGDTLRGGDEGSGAGDAEDEEDAETDAAAASRSDGLGFKAGDTRGRLLAGEKLATVPASPPAASSRLRGTPARDTLPAEPATSGTGERTYGTIPAPASSNAVGDSAEEPGDENTNGVIVGDGAGRIGDVIASWPSGVVGGTETVFPSADACAMRARSAGGTLDPRPPMGAAGLRRAIMRSIACEICLPKHP